MLKHGILGLLNYNDMNGYEILETFRDSLNHFWNAQKSQVYRELTALEKSGYITGTWEQQTGKPDKKVYSITESGKTELLEWLAEESAEGVRIPLLMKVFFMGERSIDENIVFFESLRDNYKIKYNTFTVADKANDEYSEELSDPYRSMFWGFTISYGRKRAKMIMDWCSECLKTLQAVKAGKF